MLSTQVQQLQAAGGFDAVLGSGRGSAVAQAQRDANERTRREAALETFALDVEDAAGGRESVNLLAAAYGASEATSDLTVRIHALVAQRKDSLVFAEFIACAGLGDPVVMGAPSAWVGLTDPAVQALSRYFAAPPAGEKTKVRERAMLALYWLDEPEVAHHLEDERLCACSRFVKVWALSLTVSPGIMAMICVGGRRKCCAGRLRFRSRVLCAAGWRR